MAALMYMFGKHYTEHKKEFGRDGDKGIRGSDRSLFNIGMGPFSVSGAYPARAYPAGAGGVGTNYDSDTDVNNVRTEIMNTLSTSTTDKNMLHTYLPQILAEINKDCQRGGPLWQTMDDRRRGHIDHNRFHLKLADYIRMLATRHRITIHGSGMGYGLSRPGNQGQHDHINNLINMMSKKKGFQYKYPWHSETTVIPYAPPAVTPTYPAYPKPYQNFGDFSQPEPGLCNPNQRYNYCLGRCVEYDSPIPDTCHPDLQNRVYGTY